MVFHVSWRVFTEFCKPTMCFRLRNTLRALPWVPSHVCAAYTRGCPGAALLPAVVEKVAAGSAVTRVMYLHVQTREKCFGYLIALFAKNTHSKSALRGPSALHTNASYKVPFSITVVPKRSEITLNSSRQRIYSVSPHEWAGEKRGKEPRGPCEIRKYPSSIARRLGHRQTVE